MKIISGLLIALVGAADPLPYLDYSSKNGYQYLKKFEGANACRSCIDEIGKGAFSNICYGKANDDKIDTSKVYCCNSQPSEPPTSSTPTHDYLDYLNKVDTYLEYNND